MESGEFIDRCEKDVAFFAHHILYKQKRVLSPKQIELINAFKTHYHAAGISTRQGGKSTTLGVYDTHELCFGKAKDGEPDHTFIYAPILDQTEIVMGVIHQFFNTVPLLKGYVDEQLKYSIRMKNGNTLTAMSASELSHVRGHSPTKIQIDESQDISDRKYFDDILPSGAATGAKIQETGTPKGRNHFYQLTRIKEEGLKIVYQHWEECPFIDKAYVLRRKARMPRAKFEAEFCCKFLTETNVAFATQMLDTIISLDPDEPVKIPEMRQFFLGGDIGKQDESVFVILGWDGKKLYQVDMRRLSSFASYKSVHEEIVSLYDEYNIANGLIDATREESLVDMLPDNLNVEGIFLSSEEKQGIVEEFLKLGEGNVEVGYDPQVFLWKDYDLRQQFYEWEAKKLKSGKTRYHHPKGSNDDIVIATLLACKAYIDENDVVDYGTSAITQNVRQGLSVLADNNPLSVLRHDNPFSR